MIDSIVLDRSARLLDGGRAIVGGDPPRAIRLTGAGARALARLLDDAAAPDANPAPARAEPAEHRLAQRLIDAGLAHPRLCPRPAPVTVVIPVRDRPAALARCLAAVAPTPAIVVDDGSRDAGAVAAVCADHGASLIRRERCGGPAAARNAALGCVDTELVAFLDSDCVPEARWLERLAGGLADPRVGAVAPRIRPLPVAPRAGAVARFAAARSPLDLGSSPAAVRPGGRVAYVPSAALLVRRAALRDGFDPLLRYGEDVDLVWRMLDAGWRVRYEPSVLVGHAEPARAGALLVRRWHYGTAAGPLARRHPARLAPVVIHPPVAAALALAAARRPGSAAVAVGLHAAAVHRRLRRFGVTPAGSATIAACGLRDGAAALGRATTMLAPALLVAGLARRATRTATAALLLAAPLRAYVRTRPELDPVRFTALAIADDVAYGSGVWVGALRERTTLPLRPALAGWPPWQSRRVPSPPARHPR